MKRLLKCALLSLLLTIIGTVYAYFYFQKNSRLPLAIRTFGGECTLERSFGMWAFHVYAMTPYESDSVNLKFSIGSFLLYFAIILVIIYLLSFVVDLIRKRKGSN